MKIVVTARNFTALETSALELLRTTGFEVEDKSSLGYGTGTTREQVIEALQDADIAVAGLEPIDGQVLAACPKLKMVSRRSVGYDSIDLNACRDAGVTVTRITGTVEPAVAEHVMAYLLYLGRDIERENALLHAGMWQRKMSQGIKNRVLGLVGFGNIGKEIAKRAVPFGMEVLYYCRHPKPEWEEQYHVKYCPFDELLARSDFVSANISLSDSTRGMFGAAEFAKMKPDAVFINIARSGVMDADALKEALDNGVIRAACVDVFDHEPCTDSPLMSCPNAILTPHTASFTRENFTVMNRCAAQNVLDYVNGCIRPEMQLV